MRTQSRLRAFSLVELMIVITIVSTMVAILLPAIGRAKQQAIKIVCAGNYRQLIVASNAFAADNRDAIPWLNTGSLGTLGYGGPHDTAAASIKNNELCQFSANYLNSPWTVSNGRFNLPKVMVDPGLPVGAPRQYHGTTSVYRPAMGSVGFYGDPADGGTVLGFGSFIGLYLNGTSGAGSNGGMNGRWSKRNLTLGYHGAPVTSDLVRIRFQDIRFPSADIHFLDLTACNSANASSVRIWSTPHPTPTGRAEGSNQGYFDGSVEWCDLKTMRYLYQPASPWYYTVSNQPIYWPMKLTFSGSQPRFNWGGYPTVWGWANTSVGWFGISTPNAGSTFTP